METRSEAASVRHLAAAVYRLCDSLLAGWNLNPRKS